MDIYKNDKILLRQPRITMATMGNVQLDKIIHVRSSVQSKDSQTKQTEWDIYFNWHAETPKSLQDCKIALSKDSLYKANEKLNTQEVPKYSLIRLT